MRRAFGRSKRQPPLLQQALAYVGGKSARRYLPFILPYKQEDIEAELRANAVHIASEDKAPTLTSTAAGVSRVGGRGAELGYYIVYCMQGSMIGRADKNGPQGDGINQDVSFTLNTIDRHAVVYMSVHADGGFSSYTEGVCGTLAASGGEMGGGSNTLVSEVSLSPKVKYQVRRLTPRECERLQGFPDNWTRSDKYYNVIADTERYKALGNSLAIPCVRFVLGNIVK